MIIVIAVIASFIPSLLMFMFLKNNRKDDIEYRKECNRLLGMGFGICALVMLFGAMLRIPWNMTGIGKKYPIIDRLFMCYVINAFCEELSKFLTGRKVINRNRAKVSKLDIISYFVIAAISFALLEDIIYAFGTSIGQIIVRGILMGHVPCQLLMGQLYGKAVAEDKSLFKVLALILPIIMHGTYNFLLTDGLPDWTAMVEIGLVVAETIYMIRMIFFIRKKRNDPEYCKPIFAENDEMPV